MEVKTAVCSNCGYDASDNCVRCGKDICNRCAETDGKSLMCIGCHVQLKVMAGLSIPALRLA